MKANETKEEKRIWNTTITFGSIVSSAEEYGINCMAVNEWEDDNGVEKKTNLDNIVFELFNRKHEIVLYHFACFRSSREKCNIHFTICGITIVVQLLYHKHEAFSQTDAFVTILKALKFIFATSK